MEKIILKTAFLAILFVYGVVSLRTIKVENQYDHDIWIQSLNNPEYSPLFGGRVVKLRPGTQFTYNITDRGWAGRFWPKTKCNARGEDCEFGQSMIPCPTGGCHPPADTKVEFFFPPNGDSRASYYDISLVDGYSLGAKIIPYHNVSFVSTHTCDVKYILENHKKGIIFFSLQIARDVNINMVRALLPIVR